MESAKLSVVHFNSEDVIATSGGYLKFMWKTAGSYTSWANTRTTSKYPEHYLFNITEFTPEQKQSEDYFYVDGSYVQGTGTNAYKQEYTKYSFNIIDSVPDDADILHTFSYITIGNDEFDEIRDAFKGYIQ